jgi:hypothetical protein
LFSIRRLVAEWLFYLGYNYDIHASVERLLCRYSFVQVECEARELNSTVDDENGRVFRVRTAPDMFLSLGELDKKLGPLGGYIAMHTSRGDLYHVNRANLIEVRVNEDACVDPVRSELERLRAVIVEDLSWREAIARPDPCSERAEILWSTSIPGLDSLMSQNRIGDAGIGGL